MNVCPVLRDMQESLPPPFPELLLQVRSFSMVITQIIADLILVKISINFKSSVFVGFLSCSFALEGFDAPKPSLPSHFIHFPCFIADHKFVLSCQVLPS